MQRRLPHAAHAYAAIAFGLIALVPLSVGLGACAAVDVAGTPLAGTGYDAGTATAAQAQSNTGSSTCTPTNAAPFTPPTPAQVAALPSCCTTGAAHCVPDAQLPPGTETSALATCPGGACVPDTLILSGGAPPPSCTSLSGAAGVCLSVCVPQVAQYASLLPQATCAAQELCAPCISPLDGQSTGACEIGKNTGASGGGNSCTPGGDDGGSSASPSPEDAGPVQCPHTGPPVLDPTSLPSCDPNGGAHCLSAALVPASEASQLATCPTGLCVPDSFIESGGEFIPATCTSILGAEGRCLDEMIPQVASQLSELPVATCQPYERCVPCYNPLQDGDGGTPAATGACSLSCDPGPQDPPVQVQTCCKENGVDVGDCLPTSLVSSSEQSNLSQDSCSQSTSLGTLLCVPKVMTAPGYKGTPCTAEGFLGILSGTSYTGVCLSNCLNFGFGSGLELAQGNCNDEYTCAPCTNPLTNAPTGAPGCTNTPAEDGGP
jgi:hypothetical protein